MQPPADQKKHWLRAGIVFGVALLYGLLSRLSFGWDRLDDLYRIVAWSFITLVPMGFGALTTFLGIRLCGYSHYWVWAAPMIAILLGMVLAIITELEAILCVIVAAPFLLPFALLGGFLMSAIMKKRSGNLQVSFLVLLPFLASPLEAQWSQPHEIVSIRDTIEIRANSEEVWAQIASVPAITRDEIPFQAIYLLDFPHSIAAEIDHPGVGGKRLATFERGVSFFETITEWDAPAACVSPSGPTRISSHTPPSTSTSSSVVASTTCSTAPTRSRKPPTAHASS